MFSCLFTRYSSLISGWFYGGYYPTCYFKVWFHKEEWGYGGFIRFLWLELGVTSHPLGGYQKYFKK
ncbi:MAG: hypothetical protein CVT95_06940 [Bacteroidetes bacterium HGW-Bacteroidetes-12]|nr:MAG: hypothetical protein CVT95_06940 [Bacteroidetes bacterium HGW-Bacteroidetes-12]